MPGISAVSPPIRAQPAWRQPSAMPAMMRRADLDLELAGGEIIEEKQRLGALDHDVVDAHRDEVDAHRVVQAGVDGHLELGADAVGAGHQDGVAETRGLEVEQAAEAAEAADHAAPAVLRASGLICVDQRVAASISTPASL